MDIDHNVPTFFRGNREFGTTLAGTRALLRRADGSLTRRGETYYQRPEVIVRIPAIQRGNSSRGEQYEISTHKVLTEHEYPEIGNLWRNTGGDDTAKARAVKAWVTAQFTGNLIMEESDQEWLYDNTRPFEFLVRRLVQNQLQVNRIPLNGTVLQYEFLDLKKPCEYQRGGQCVVQQCAICLRMSESDVEYYLDLAFGEVSHGAPFNGDDWRNVGVSTEMMEKFAEMLDIGLHVFHGKQKIFQRSASSHDSPSLTYHQWDGHAFFELCSKSQMKKTIGTPDASRYCIMRKPRSNDNAQEWSYYETVQDGSFYTDDIQSVRLAWLNEHVVPKTKCRDVGEFTSISRGNCVVHQAPMFFHELRLFTQELGMRYRGEGIGSVTLQALEFVLNRKHRFTEKEKLKILNEQQKLCAICGTLLLNAWECDHVPRAAESTECIPRALCKECHKNITLEQNTAHGKFHLQSELSPHAIKHFHEQPAPVPLIFKHGTVGKKNERQWMLDLVRCRANCLRHPSCDFCIFNPLDNIRPCNNTLGDWTFIDAGEVRNSATALHMLPYTGRG